MTQSIFNEKFDDNDELNHDPMATIAFNHYDLQHAKEVAFQEGVNAGKNHEDIIVSQNANAMLQQLNIFCEQLTKTQAAQEQEIWKNAINIAKLMLDQLLPTLQENILWKEFLQNLSDTIQEMAKDCHLKLFLHPDCVTLFQDWFAKSNMTNDLVLYTDAKLPLWDFRLEWDEGGVERCFHKVKQSLDDWLNQWLIQETNGAVAEPVAAVTTPLLNEPEELMIKEGD